jgi:pimeloyl-ACP methyl ester carboxylesterase
MSETSEVELSAGTIEYNDSGVNGWLRPLQTDPGVRYNLARYARNARRSQMLEVCDRLRSFACPALVIWGTRGPRAAARPRPAAGGIPAKRAARPRSPTATR